MLFPGAQRLLVDQKFQTKFGPMVENPALDLGVADTAYDALNLRKEPGEKSCKPFPVAYMEGEEKRRSLDLWLECLQGTQVHPMEAVRDDAQKLASRMDVQAANVG